MQHPFHQSLFVFDIETIPDTDVVQNLTGCASDDIHVLRKELENYHLQITEGKNAFPRQLFHKVVAISYLEADIIRDGQGERYQLRRLKSGAHPEEKGLLQGFFQYLGNIKPRLVSFNGRSFDLPVLKYRAMMHGVSAGWLYSTGDKWNNYTQKYSLDWHCDLFDALSDFGLSARIKLNEVCAILGLPGKIGVDGSKVQGMYDAGQLEEIRNYCETDVLNTYLVYLRYMYHRGSLTLEGYNEAIVDIRELLDKEKESRAYLKEFGDAWEQSCRGRYVISG